MATRKPLRPRPAPDVPREQLKRWLASRMIDLRLREVPDPPFEAGPQTPATPDDKCLTPVRPHLQTPMTTGEIRLASNDLLPGANRPVYLAVFRDWETGWKLVAPFGPYGEPATPGELAFPDKPHALRVLCLWNTHSLPDDALKATWAAGELSAQEVDAAWHVFRHVTTGAMLPEDLRARVGTTLLGPNDPRIAYLDEEMELMRPLAEMAIRCAQETTTPIPALRESVTRSNRVRLPWVRAACSERDVALAAAEPMPPRYESLFEAPDLSLFCRVCLETDWRTCSLLVVDMRGQPSGVLDGFGIPSRGPEPLWHISRSQARMPVDRLALGLSICSSTGETVRLLPRVLGAGRTLPDGSYASLERRLRLWPKSVSTLADGDLAVLAHLPPVDPALAALVVGEALVRRWLYTDRCPPALLTFTQRREFMALSRAVQEAADPLRNVTPQPQADLAPELNRNFDSMRDALAWDHFAGRVIDFLTCDGIFPLAVGRDCREALAVPFRFVRNRAGEPPVTDRRGRLLAEWSEIVEKLERDMGAKYSVRILCEFADGIHCIEGGSLAFALLVAKHLARKALQLPPLEILATGAIQGGRLEEVSGVEVKRALGDRLGCCLFIAPGSFEDKFVLSLAPGQSAKDLARSLAREMRVIWAKAPEPATTKPKQPPRTTRRKQRGKSAR